MESVQEELFPKCYAGGQTAEVVVGWAAWQTAGRRGKDDAEEGHHSEVGTGEEERGEDRSWEGKEAGHKERGIEQAEALGRGNRDLAGERKCKWPRSDKQGSTCKG
jgi:hypothetical protein